MATALDTIKEPQKGADAGTPRRKTVHRKSIQDRSQGLRLAVQVLFLVLNLAIGWQFLLFVRSFEAGAPHSSVSRPAGVEGWLPIAGLMNLKYFVLTGSIPQIHPAAMYLLVCFLTVSVLFRKAFCGWLCPVGTVSEFLWKLGRRFFKKNPALPTWLDLPLRSLKYILLGLFFYAVGGLPADGIRSFMASPYGIIADVKMLNFFRLMGMAGLVTITVLVLLSVVIQNFWCRYLCPYGALMGLASLLSPARIRRNSENCIDCAKCSRACPSRLPVDKLATVRSAECSGCLECVAACPVRDALAISLPRHRRIPDWALAAGICAVFLTVVLFAKWTGGWNGQIPDSLYRQLIPRASEFKHF